MTRRVPLFALRDVVDLAKAGKVLFSKSTERSLAEMGISRERAKEIVAWLTEDEFHERWFGEGTAQWWDVYLAPRRVPDKPQIILYVKFRIPAEPVVRQVYVTSLHPQKTDQ